MRLTSATLTSAGGRAVNEDSLACHRMLGFDCAIIADGAGGHRGGATASALAVEAAAAAFARRPELSEARLRAIFAEADAALRARQQADAALHDMCSTLAFAAIDSVKGRAIWGQVGDTRIYHFRQGRLHSVSADHSAVQQLVAAGLLPADAIRGHPQRGVLTAALGMEDGEQQAGPASHILPDAVALAEGDTLLLCSDGFWDLVGEAEMERTLQQATGAQQWLDSMEAALQPRVHAGSDNYSAVALLFARG